MNGDISRNTFDQLKHYTRVVMQQGRVQLDADWNEQVALLLHYLQALAQDLIGPHGGPADIEDAGQVLQRNNGFAILSAKNGTEINEIEPPLSDETKDRLNATVGQNIPILISAGRYYVDGRLSEDEDYLFFSDQLDYPLLGQNKHPLSNRRNFDLPDGEPLLVYLDVWERHITTIEDESIREVALGGAETAARSKLVWQVKIESQLTSPETITDCDSLDPAGSASVLWETLVEKWQPARRGQLKAKARGEDDGTAPPSDPCVTPPDARFRGTENQLYRVEIHRGGHASPSGDATFKWSRDNGTIVARVLKVSGADLTVSGMRDSSRWFAPGDWVEITHDALELNGLYGTMVRLVKVDGESLTVDRQTTVGEIFDPKSAGLKNVKVRRWDQKERGDETLDGGAIPIVESGQGSSGWIELEDGVMIQFQPSGNSANPHTYRTGDYWLIPARLATGDVEWPGDQGNPKAVAPHGVDHHYAPLAKISLSSGAIDGDVLDLRHSIERLGVC